MNINLDDKKIKKIVYAIDEISELDILFENGEITSLNRRYKSAMKPDTFLSSMIDSSRKLGKAIIERNKKYGQALTKNDEDKKVKESMTNLFTAKKLIEMDKDGKIDEIVKAHNQYVTNITEGKEPTSYKDYLTKCDQESNNGEESLKRFEDGLDKMNMYDNIKPILDELVSKDKANKPQPKPIEKLPKLNKDTFKESLCKSNCKDEKCANENCDKCDEECCHKNVSDLKIQERIEECERAMDSLGPNVTKILSDVRLDALDSGVFNRITKILIELDKLGFYDLDDNERKEKKDEYIKNAVNNAKDRDERNRIL